MSLLDSFQLCSNEKEISSICLCENLSLSRISGDNILLTCYSINWNRIKYHVLNATIQKKDKFLTLTYICMSIIYR